MNAHQLGVDEELVLVDTFAEVNGCFVPLRVRKGQAERLDLLLQRIAHVVVGESVVGHPCVATRANLLPDLRPAGRLHTAQLEERLGVRAMLLHGVSLENKMRHLVELLVPVQVITRLRELA